MMMKYIILAFFYLGFIGILLCFPDNTIHYAYQGLTQWATRMVPTLFPFMMISSMMIHTGVDIYVTKCLKPFLKPLFKCTSNSFYAIIMGFLCGFPMGAKATCDLHRNKKISKSEAEYLLAFCNNIGPTYFLGIIFPMLEHIGYHNKFLLLFGVYGIPLLYGIFFGRIKRNNDLSPQQPSENNNKNSMPIPVSTALRLACVNSIQSILLLGGYVTFVNAFRAIPEILQLSDTTKSILGLLLEIINGVPELFYTESLSPKWMAFLIMTGISFNGICCLLQTSSITLEEGFSMKKYIFHKIMITGISGIYYFILFL